MATIVRKKITIEWTAPLSSRTAVVTWDDVTFKLGIKSRPTNSEGDDPENYSLSAADLLAIREVLLQAYNDTRPIGTPPCNPH